MESPLSVVPKYRAFKNLVFEGGGPKGLAYIGAMTVLQQRGLLAPIEQVAGSSAGAITATILALGYTLNECAAMVGEDFGVLLGDGSSTSLFYTPKVLDIAKNYGMNKGELFLNWIAKKIEAKLGKPNANFADLQTAVLKQGLLIRDDKFRELYIIGTNLSTEQREIFSYCTTPEMPIAQAVRVSMSIPFFFVPCHYPKENGKFVMDKNGWVVTDKKRGDIYVDGGLIENFPIDLFDAGFPTIETLGFKVDSAEEIASIRDRQSLRKTEINGVKDFTMSVLNAAMNAQARYQANENYRSVYIDTSQVHTTQFQLSKQDKDYLAKQGEICTKEYFLNWYEDALAKKTGLASVREKERAHRYEQYHIYDHASGIHLASERLQIVFCLADGKPWNFLEEKVIRYYERLYQQPNITSLQHYKIPHNKTQILVIVANENLVMYAEKWLKKHPNKQLNDSIKLDVCILLRERIDTIKPDWMRVPPPYKKDQEKLAQLIHMGNVNKVLDLIHNGIPVSDYVDEKNNTFLHLLAKTSRTELVLILLKQGLQINTKNHFHDIPLHYACSIDNLSDDPQASMAATLIKHGSDINARNKQGQTPLIVAAQWGHVGAIGLLLNEKADTHLSDQSGLTAWEALKHYCPHLTVDPAPVIIKLRDLSLPSNSKTMVRPSTAFFSPVMNSDSTVDSTRYHI